MYNLESVRRRVKKIGVTQTLALLADPNFPDSIKEDLSKEKIFIGGYPNVELITSLAS